METRRSAPIIPAIVLILIGVWLLLQNLQIPGLRFDAWWPLLLIVGGIALLVRRFTRPVGHKEDLGGGVFLTLLGVFFFGFYNFDWFNKNWSQAWPIFPLLVGASNFVEWLFDWRNWGNLLWSFAGLIVAAVGFAYTGGIISGDFALQIARLWPVFLILAGLGFLLQGVLSRREP